MEIFSLQARQELASFILLASHAHFICTSANSAWISQHLKLLTLFTMSTIGDTGYAPIKSNLQHHHHPPHQGKTSGV